MSAFRHHVIEFGGFNETRRVLADGQGVEMRLAAFDFSALAVAEIVGEQAALGFDDEVEALRAVFFHEHGPVWIVGAQGRRDFEPGGQFGVNLDRLVFLQLLGK